MLQFCSLRNDKSIDFFCIHRYTVFNKKTQNTKCVPSLHGPYQLSDLKIYIRKDGFNEYQNRICLENQFVLSKCYTIIVTKLCEQLKVISLEYCCKSRQLFTPTNFDCHSFSPSFHSVLLNWKNILFYTGNRQITSYSGMPNIVSL